MEVEILVVGQQGLLRQVGEAPAEVVPAGEVMAALDSAAALVLAVAPQDAKIPGVARALLDRVINDLPLFLAFDATHPSAETVWQSRLTPYDRWLGGGRAAAGCPWVPAISPRSDLAKVIAAAKADLRGETSVHARRLAKGRYLRRQTVLSDLLDQFNQGFEVTGSRPNILEVPGASPSMLPVLGAYGQHYWWSAEPLVGGGFSRAIATEQLTNPLNPRMDLVLFDCVAPNGGGNALDQLWQILTDLPVGRQHLLLLLPLHGSLPEMLQKEGGGALLIGLESRFRDVLGVVLHLVALRTIAYKPEDYMPKEVAVLVELGL